MAFIRASLTIGWGEPVELMTMSTRARASSTRSRGSAFPLLHRQLLSLAEGAVGDGEVGGSFLQHVSGGELAHLSRSDQQHRARRQILEDLAGELGGGTRHRNGSPPQSRLGSNLLFF